MTKTRSLIERTYRVVPLKDGTFAVEIAIMGTHPTTAAKTFATEAEAEAWIAREEPPPWTRSGGDTVPDGFQQRTAR